jgi:hypothetical protein
MSRRASLNLFCVPSTLLPALMVVLPSTTSSVAFLFAKMGDSSVVACDVMIGLVGVAVIASPFCIMLVIWRAALQLHHPGEGLMPASAISCERVPTPEESGGSITSVCGGALVVAYVKELARQRWKWKGAALSQLTFASVLLQEYRLVWYAVVDAAVLAVSASAAVAGGLNRSSDTLLCRGCGVGVMFLMCLQLMMLVFVQPYTSLLAFAVATLTLGLTCLGTACQLVLMFMTPPDALTELWLIEAAAVCDLAVVGASGIKTLLDLRIVVTACQRRLDMRRRWERSMNDALPVNNGADDDECSNQFNRRCGAGVPRNCTRSDSMTLLSK